MSDDGFDAEVQRALYDSDLWSGMSSSEPLSLVDGILAERLCDSALSRSYCWNAALGWLAYENGRWSSVSEERVREAIRSFLVDLREQAVRSGDIERTRSIEGALGAGRIRGLTTLARGVVEVEAHRFDAEPYLLNVVNGVVDLRSAELLPHSPDYYFTKSCPVPFDPHATSNDWEQALGALDPDVHGWLQDRCGQAITGFAVPDDKLVILEGWGSNGKTTLVSGIMAALGDYGTNLSERVLGGTASDHPTELMPLRGARFALVEELPEGRRLPAKRLKDLVGTREMTARLVKRDNVTWTCTHALFVTTNHRPVVEETDHGTWRRLVLVRFRKTFAPLGVATLQAGVQVGDPHLRSRIQSNASGQLEAVLAWLVAGAMSWFLNNREFPPTPASVAGDTESWRQLNDHVAAYVAARIDFDPGAHVASVDLHRDFVRWMSERGEGTWSDQVFAKRFGQHEVVSSRSVTKRQLSSSQPGRSVSGPSSATAGARYMAWNGIRFRSVSA